MMLFLTSKTGKRVGFTPGLILPNGDRIFLKCQMSKCQMFVYSGLNYHNYLFDFFSGTIIISLKPIDPKT